MHHQSTQRTSDETNCPNCGAVWDIHGGLGVCGYCGTPMPEPPPPPPIYAGHICTTTGTSFVVSGTLPAHYLDSGAFNHIIGKDTEEEAERIRRDNERAWEESRAYNLFLERRRKRSKKPKPEAEFVAPGFKTVRKF